MFHAQMNRKQLIRDFFLYWVNKQELSLFEFIKYNRLFYICRKLFILEKDVKHITVPDI